MEIVADGFTEQLSVPAAISEFNCFFLKWGWLSELLDQHLYS